MATDSKPRVPTQPGTKRQDLIQSGGAPGLAPLDFDDDEIYSGRGRMRDGGTTHARGGDSGKLGPPAEQLSASNGPSDPANRKAGQ
ncbi:hypothetical protein [uncultured Variovorax sp.]|uniref:hypothetical protein n=1 Tax=uncultured Variovorax sp. TaxID=114708 RepID=UPI0025D80B61|nr:hypothetical protein [uncultured Variovorax sp.]